jgi:hypothetical protein
VQLKFLTRCWWLTPIILDTLEAEIRRIEFPGQPGQKAKTPIYKITRAARVVGVA